MRMATFDRAVSMNFAEQKTYEKLTSERGSWESMC